MNPIRYDYQELPQIYSSGRNGGRGIDVFEYLNELSIYKPRPENYVEETLDFPTFEETKSNSLPKELKKMKFRRWRTKCDNLYSRKRKSLSKICDYMYKLLTLSWIQDRKKLY